MIMWFFYKEVHLWIQQRFWWTEMNWVRTVVTGSLGVGRRGKGVFGWEAVKIRLNSFKTLNIIQSKSIDIAGKSGRFCCEWIYHVSFLHLDYFSFSESLVEILSHEGVCVRACVGRSFVVVDGMKFFRPNCSGYISGLFIRGCRCFA